MTGSIKDYTPNFEFIIPEFNITGWHDYLEENFRSIDALFYNLFGINNFKGQWKNSTVYNVDDVVFIGEDTDYSGRLVKVLVQHTTAGTGNFTEFFTANPSYYELFADASTAQIFAQEAKDWAVKLDGPVEDDLYSSKFYANMVNDLSTEITTLYNIRSDIQNVSLIGTEVVNVSNIKNSVQTVASMQSDINDVVAIKSDIEWIADNDTIVTNVSNNSTKITTVANNISSVNTTATNITDISITATNIASVNTNATNISAINTNASNISAIQGASSNAQSALNSKNLAQNWAISEDIVDNTDYSAKHYAEIASQHENPLRIGQMVESTIPLNDAGLHLLDGSLIQGNGIYSEFVTYIAGLVSTYPDIFETEANWQTSVTNYGTCGKFVYDNVNNTVRLPLISGFTEGTNDLTALGVLTQAGVPNITGQVRYGNSGDIGVNTSYISGAFYADTGTNAKSASSGSQTNYPLLFDASRSSSIYGRSSTVQPQSIKVLRYICIATSTKTDIEVDIDEIATDLNNKLDKNDLIQVHCVVETYVNGTSWYRVYDDGWCEQGGKFVITSASVGSDSYNTAILTFIKPFTKCITYNVQAKHDRFNAGFVTEVSGQALSQVDVYQVNDSGTSFANPFVIWTACGYIS